MGKLCCSTRKVRSWTTSWACIWRTPRDATTTPTTLTQQGIMKQHNRSLRLLHKWKTRSDRCRQPWSGAATIEEQVPHWLRQLQVGWTSKMQRRIGEPDCFWSSMHECLKCVSRLISWSVKWACDDLWKYWKCMHSLALASSLFFVWV